VFLQLWALFVPSNTKKLNTNTFVFSNKVHTHKKTFDKTILGPELFGVVEMTPQMRDSCVV